MEAKQVNSDFGRDAEKSGFWDSDKFRAGIPEPENFRDFLAAHRKNHKEIQWPRECPIRSSYIVDLRKCPRYFMWKDRFGLRRRGEFSFALSTGKIYHWMCEGMYLGKSQADALRYAGDQIQTENTRVRDKADDTGLLPDGTPVETIIAETERAFSMAQMMFMISFDKFFAPKWIVDEGWKPLLVETRIDVRTALPIPIMCKPDALLIRPSDGAIMIVNHKTTSFSVQTLSPTYPFSIQVILESLGTQALFPNAPRYFYLHNVIRKCTLRFPAKKYPTFEDYLEACRQWYIDENEKNPDDPPMAQNLQMLEKGFPGTEVYYRIYEAYRASICNLNPERFFRDSSACFGHFHNRACPYLPLCQGELPGWAECISRIYDITFREDEEDAE